MPVPIARITSYNVCYTKLLRMPLTCFGDKMLDKGHVQMADPQKSELYNLNDELIVMAER